MLTLAEIESTQQFEFERQLEALDEQALQDLLTDPAALRRSAPGHLNDAELRTLAEAALAEVQARKATARPPGPGWAWPPVFSWFWGPPR